MIYRLVRFLVGIFCRHYFIAAGSTPCAEGIVTRRICVRCNAVEHVLHRERKRTL